MDDFEQSKIEFTGYYPGAIGQVTENHAVYYHKHWGFDVTFEAQVGSELSEFLREFRQDRDYFQIASLGGRFAGAIAIDGRSSKSEGARLRWFVVAEGLQGRGIGKALINKAIEHCRKAGHRKVFLWTFKGLDPARHLYEDAGFSLAEEHQVDQWGTRLLEQKFEMTFESECI